MKIKITWESEDEALLGDVVDLLQARGASYRFERDCKLATPEPVRVYGGEGFPDVVLCEPAAPVPPAIGERCATCDQRLDAEGDRDTYHAALLEQRLPFQCGVHSTLYDPGVCADCDFVRKTRAEEAVLSAMEHAPEADINFLASRACGLQPTNWMARVASAELALRRAKGQRLSAAHVPHSAKRT